GQWMFTHPGVVCVCPSVMYGTWYAVRRSLTQLILPPHGNAATAALTSRIPCQMAFHAIPSSLSRATISPRHTLGVSTGNGAGLVVKAAWTTAWAKGDRAWR